MAINSLAPDVYSTIQDKTDVVDAVPGTVGFIALVTEKGKDNEIVPVTQNTFYNLYGGPNYDYTKNISFGMGPYVASKFLEESDNLYVVRVMPDNASFSHIIMRTGGFDVTGSSEGDLTGDLSGYGYQMSFYLDWLTPSDTSGIKQLNTYREIKQLVDMTDTTSWIFDSNEENDSVVLCFYGIGRGSYYNKFQIDLSPHPNDMLRDEGLYILDIYKRQELSQRFSTSTTIEQELLDYELIESFVVSFDPDATDTDGDSQFIEDVLNNYSQEIRCYANRLLLEEITRRASLEIGDIDRVVADYTTAFSTYRWRQRLNKDDENGVYDEETYYDILSGNAVTYGAYMLYGTDGDLFQNTSIGFSGNLIPIRKINDGSGGVGTLLQKAYAGTLKNIWADITTEDSTSDEYVDGVNDTENYSFDVVFDAGYPFDVKTSIVDLVDTRRDCIAIIDNGDHHSANTAINARKTDSTQTFGYNTRYAALYTPYTKIADPWTGHDIWVPPSVHMAKIIAFSDKNFGVGQPLAGFNRATIQNIKAQRFYPNHGDRDRFIRYQLNPIVKFNTGFSVFSQRTTQKRASVANEIHVVRNVIKIEKTLKAFCRQFIHELNPANKDLWERINNGITEYLEQEKMNDVVTNYNVSVGASDYDIKLRRLNVDVSLRMTRSVEQIYLNFFLE